MSLRLSTLQSRVLAKLAGIEPPWTLTGGAALAGFHLGHRTTRDLDLFWHGKQSVAEVRREVVARLQADGLEVVELRSTPAFCALQVRDGQQSVVVDLVAEPVATIEPPELRNLGGVSIAIDTRHEILVNKLCALLHRSEVRDLLDTGTARLLRVAVPAPRSVIAAARERESVLALPSSSRAG